MTPINKFKLQNGKRDPAMRQRAPNDDGFIKISRNEPQSLYLQELQRFFTSDVLSMLDGIVGSCPKGENAVKAALSASTITVPKDKASVTERLVLLALKKGELASVLWQDIMAVRTPRLIASLHLSCLSSVQPYSTPLLDPYKRYLLTSCLVLPHLTTNGLT